MLRITIELIPASGLPPKHLGTACIINDGTGSAEVGNYDVKLSKWGRPNQTWKKGRVEDFDRVQRGPWDLFYLALKNIVGNRNRRR